MHSVITMITPETKVLTRLRTETKIHSKHIVCPSNLVILNSKIYRIHKTESKYRIMRAQRRAYIDLEYIEYFHTVVVTT